MQLHSDCMCTHTMQHCTVYKRIGKLWRDIVSKCTDSPGMCTMYMWSEVNMHMIWAGNVAVQHAQGVYMRAVYTHSYTDNSERNETVGVHNAQSTSSQLQHTLQQTNSPYCIYIGKLSWGRGLSGVNECTGNTLHFIQQVAVLHSSMHHELVGLLCLRQMLGL